VTVAAGGTYDIAAGLVYLDGEIRRFEGVTGVTLPQELYSDAFTTTELRAYQVGGSKATMGEAVVLARPYDAALAVDKVRVEPEGVLRLTKAREAVFREVGEGGFLFDFSANDYDTSGRGKYGTKAYGWAQIPAMGGRVAVGYDSTQADYNATRKVGGVKEVRLTADQNGAHAHNMQQAGEHDHGMNNAASNNNGTTGFGDTYAKSFGNAGNLDQNRRTSRAGNHAHTIDSSGLGDAHENRQPYMTVLYRIWIGF